ncbi:MAG: restriction endonuclease [Burkholderiales bacterium]|nr:restriction endonuclease [Burkholderiales bacterium]
MKLPMHRNSLFAILLRSRWWISFAVALGLFLVVRLFIPEAYAIVVPIPFVVIGCIAAWRQLRAPSAGRVAERLAALRAMSWQAFCAALEAAYRSEGYAVQRLGAGAADLELRRDGERILVGAKRWKVARAGVEPLRALAAAGTGEAPAARVFVAAGEVSEQARAFAAGNGIRILEGAELAALLARGASARA